MDVKTKNSGRAIRSRWITLGVVAALMVMVMVLVSRRGYGTWIEAIALSPNGQHLIVANNDRQLTLWEVPSRKRIWTTGLPGRRGSRALSMLYLGQGNEFASSETLILDQWLITPAGGSQLAIRSATTGKERYKLQHIGGTQALAVAALVSGWRVATMGDTGIIVLEQQDTAMSRSLIDFTQRSLRTLSFSADAKMLVATGYDHCSVWDVETGEPRMSVELEGPGMVSDATFTSDGAQVLLVNSKDDHIRYFDVATGEEVRRVRWLTGFRQLSVSGDHTRMASCGHRELGVMVWEVDTGRRLATFGEENHYSHVAISLDGKVVAGVRVGSKDVEGIDTWGIKVSVE